ncbi:MULTISPECIES: penicillin-binding transpeptidase domain-containing protein [Rhodophyticola]|jgi:beta-lactamase class D|uniref:penicillin-binding transpeptidase domain-containing protein n=1 Tax=Rhodophyticola TaxID=2680018 RepID=UPI0035D06274
MFALLKQIMRTAFAVACLCGVASPIAAQSRMDIARAPLASEIGTREVSFLARDLETDTDYVLEGSDLSLRHPPWSTFKIPNLLIALETGAAASLETPYIWDRARRPARGFWPPAWRQDQTLGTAFQRSAVWVFRDIAGEVGTGRYRQRLGEWGYGNASVPDGSDDFWLGDTLQISVSEQVAFLERFFAGTLGLSVATSDALISVSRAGTFGPATLHGKTGSGPVIRGDMSGPFEGWYTGFVLRPDAEPVVFSLYTRADSYAELESFRQDFAIHLLQTADLLPLN